MNVLLTSVGRRSYLVEYFRDALSGSGKVFATNSIAKTPGMIAADHAFEVPPASSADFGQVIIDICKNYDIDLLCSLHDWELPVIADLRDTLRKAGTIAVVSTKEVVDICLDKQRTVEFGLRNDLRTPLTQIVDTSFIPKQSMEYPVFPRVVKPRFGHGSIGVEIVHDSTEMNAAIELVGRRLRRMNASAFVSGKREGESVLIQEMISGDEYGLDVVNDLKGRFVTCFVKKKWSMRAGETDDAEVVDFPELEAVGKQIGGTLRHVGNLDVDIIVDQDGPVLLEMNPRFGGHYPFSHEAGANIPAALLAWARAEEPDPTWLRVSTGMRFAKDIRLVRL